MATLTVDNLIADHAEPLAKTVDVTLDDYYRSPDGFPSFLEAAAERSPDPAGGWLHEAADCLNADATTQEALREVDQLLHDARADLERA
jgi:hypothetical protein